MANLDVKLVAMQRPWFMRAIWALYLVTLACNKVSPRLSEYIRERGVSLLVRYGWKLAVK